jgi:hypothetical protein
MEVLSKASLKTEDRSYTEQNRKSFKSFRCRPRKNFWVGIQVFAVFVALEFSSSGGSAVPGRKA